MNVLEKLNVAIEYIESNIANEIKYKEVAELTNSSAYNFHRIFNYIIGFSVTEYVRNRRLTLAAVELQQRGTKVIDIALKYSYDSPVSFARAFTAFHGVSPSKVQNGQVSLKAFPRLSFNIQIIGAKEMNYRIEKKHRFYAFGVEKEFPHAGDNMQIPHFFSECFENGTLQKLKELSENSYRYKDMPTISSLGCGENKEEENFTLMIGGLIFDEKPHPKDLKTRMVPANNWAIFKSDSFKDGSEDEVKVIQGLWERIFKEWLPSSGYDLADAPGIEQDYFQNPDACFVEIWVPVVKS